MDGPDKSEIFFGMSRAGSVSGPVVYKCFGPEVSRGQTWFAAGSVLELQLNRYLNW